MSVGYLKNDGQVQVEFVRGTAHSGKDYTAGQTATVDVRSARIYVEQRRAKIVGARTGTEGQVAILDDKITGPHTPIDPMKAFNENGEALIVEGEDVTGDKGVVEAAVKDETAATKKTKLVR
ncbi:MAG: hypothetical protein MSG64_15675 [Pyrinomonadaceae bacterium MAG19_C2-C3]|nr:hypothetical protein [Pyrinomonadaceae bacterium MAG19_C2-C3]